MSVNFRELKSYSKQNITESDIKNVVDVLQSDFLSRGPKIIEFEKNLGYFCKNNNVITTNSATSALHLGYKVSGITKGSVVWTTPITFVATANIGNEYTSTRVMDKALMDRFTIVEMDVLTDEEELGLLTYMFPHVDPDLLKAVSEIAHTTRMESKSDTGKVSTGVSTRTSVEMAGLIYDGFGLDEASEVSIYPQFADDGGVDSERTFVKQLVQKYMNDGSDENLFNEDDDSSDDEF